MNLQEALNELAAALDVDAEILNGYADEIDLGGWHPDPTQRQWDIGSIFAVEGKFLYALVRALKPRSVVEIGVYRASSTTYILSALAKNKKGHLTSFDVAGVLGDGPPEELRKRWTFVTAQGELAIREGEYSADMVLEDGPHDTDGTLAILSAVKDKLNPRLTLSHDAEHAYVGADIRAAWRAVYGDEFRTLLISPSDCGFAYRVRPND